MHTNRKEGFGPEPVICLHLSMPITCNPKTRNEN